MAIINHTGRIRVGRRLLVALAAPWLAYLCVAHGPVHERIRQLDERLKEAPGAAGLWVERAELHRVDGALEQALADLNSAEALGAEVPGLRWVRARVNSELGRAEAARLDLDRWLEANPGHVEGLGLRGVLRRQAGDAEGAVADLTAAIRASRKPEPELYLERAQAARAVGREGLERALAGLEDGLRSLGSLVALEVEAAGIEEALGRVDAAAGRYERMARGAARPEAWRVRRAELLARAGRAEEALKEWERAYEDCCRLPAGRRGAAAQRVLEERIRGRLGAEAVALIERRVAGGGGVRGGAAPAVAQETFSRERRRTLPPP